MTTYLIRYAEEQNRKFYEHYDPFFIASKAKLLMFITERWDDFGAFGKERGFDLGQHAEKSKTGFRAQIRFAEFQQFEAAFALMLAEFQALPHWVYLTTYLTGDLLKAAQKFVDGDADSVSAGQSATMESFLSRAIYSGRMPAGATTAESWASNIEHIQWLLRVIAARYVKAASFGGEYNAFKHGLRVLTGSSQVRVSATPDFTDAMTLAESKDSVTFLEVKPEGDGEKRVYEVVRHFNPVESYQFIDFLSLLASNMKKSRLAALKGSTEVQLHQFGSLHKQAIRNLSNHFEYRMG